MMSRVFAAVMLVALGAAIVWARATPDLLHPVADGPIALLDGSESSLRQRGEPRGTLPAGAGHSLGSTADEARMRNGRTSDSGTYGARAVGEPLDPATRTAVAAEDVVDLVLDRAASIGTTEPVRDGTDLWTSERGSAEAFQEGASGRDRGTGDGVAATEARDLRLAAIGADAVAEDDLERRGRLAPVGNAGSTGQGSPGVLANDGSGGAGAVVDTAGAATSAAIRGTDQGARIARPGPGSGDRAASTHAGDGRSLVARDTLQDTDDATGGKPTVTLAAERLAGVGASDDIADDGSGVGSRGVPGSQEPMAAGAGRPPGGASARPRLAGIDMAAAETGPDAGRDEVGARAASVQGADMPAEPSTLKPPEPARLSDAAARAFAADVERGVAAYRAGDYAAAARFWRPAAEADVAKAQFHMGGMTLEGRLAEPDPLAAFLWLDRAYANGFSAARPLLRAAEEALGPADRAALEALLGRSMDRES